MEYNDISKHFRKNDMIKSLSDGKVKKYGGHLVLVGDGLSAVGFDSGNTALEVYKNGVLAEVIEKGIDEEAEWNDHINNVRNVCGRLGCSTRELLNRDYINELKG